MEAGGRPEQPGTDKQAFLKALRELDEALDANIARAHVMKRRIADIESGLAAGLPLREVVPGEQTPPLVALLSKSADNLASYGSRVRRAEARALHQEGLTMDEIAKLFGVTRQRVSALLRYG